jgi:hypothetical protein
MDEAKMVAQLISVRPTNGWSLGDEVTRRDIEILRHCEEVVLTSAITDGCPWRDPCRARNEPKNGA